MATSHNLWRCFMIALTVTIPALLLNKNWFSNKHILYLCVALYNKIEAGVHLNRSEIGSIIKRKFMLGLKWIGNTTRQLTTPNESPRLVGDCLDKFQFSEKNYLFPKMSKNHPKIYTKPSNGGYGNKQRDLALLKTWHREPSHPFRTWIKYKISVIARVLCFVAVILFKDVRAKFF